MLTRNNTLGVCYSYIKNAVAQPQLCDTDVPQLCVPTHACLVYLAMLNHADHPVTISVEKGSRADVLCAIAMQCSMLSVLFHPVGHSPYL